MKFEEEEMSKEKFDLHKLTIMLDKCEDDLKLALEYMEEHEKDFEKDCDLRTIKFFLTKFVRGGDLSDLQKINFMLYQKEKLAKAKALLKEWIVCHGGTKEFHSALQDKTEDFLKEA